MQTKALPFSVPVLSEQAETNLKKLILNLVVGRTAAELFSPIKQRPLTLCLMFLDAGNRKWLIKPELKLEVLEAVKRIKIIRDSGFEPDPNQIALLKKAAREVLADIPRFSIDWSKVQISC